MHNYKELNVWQKAIDLSTSIYEITKSFPSNEQYGLISQLRRCAVSIPSNIAEGAGRNTNGEFNQFLGIANGSCFELETQLTISKNLKYIDENTLNQLLEIVTSVQKMIFSLKKTIITKK